MMQRTTASVVGFCDMAHSIETGQMQRHVRSPRCNNILLAVPDPGNSQYSSHRSWVDMNVAQALLLELFSKAPFYKTR